MHTLGVKEIVINDIAAALTPLQSDGITAGTTVANTVKYRIEGFGEFLKANISAPVMMRAKAKAVKIATITAGTDLVVSAIAETVKVLVRLATVTGRYEAEYVRAKQNFGKPYTFDFLLPANASDNVAVVNLYKALKGRIDLFNDLPFTVAIDSTNPADAGDRVITLTGKSGLEHIAWTFDPYAPATVKAAADNADVLGVFTTLSMTQTQAASVGRGLGSWLEQNVSMYTPQAVRLTAEKRDQLPIISASYLTVHFRHKFTSDMVAAPAFVGELSQEGYADFVLYINETGKADAQLAILLENLIGLTGAIYKKADDTDAAGASDALKAADLVA